MKYLATITMMRYLKGPLGAQQMTVYRSRTLDLEPDKASRGYVLNHMQDLLGPGFEPAGDAVLMFFDVQPDQLPTSADDDFDLDEYRDDVLAAVDKFERDAGFTAPEMFPMRIEQLRERIRDIFEDDEDDEDEGSDGEASTVTDAIREELQSLRSEVKDTLGLGALMGHPVLDVISRRIASCGE